MALYRCLYHDIVCYRVYIKYVNIFTKEQAIQELSARSEYSDSLVYTTNSVLNSSKVQDYTNTEVDAGADIGPVVQGLRRFLSLRPFSPDGRLDRVEHTRHCALEQSVKHRQTVNTLSKYIDDEIFIIYIFKMNKI